MQWRSKQKGENLILWVSPLVADDEGTFLPVKPLCAFLGLVGISLTADWGEPVDMTNQRDIEAAERYIQFYMGWFATPVFHGDYPQVMKEYIGMSQAVNLENSSIS